MSCLSCPIVTSSVGDRILMFTIFQQIFQAGISLCSLHPHSTERFSSVPFESVTGDLWSFSLLLLKNNKDSPSLCHSSFYRHHLSLFLTHLFFQVRFHFKYSSCRTYFILLIVSWAGLLCITLCYLFQKDQSYTQQALQIMSCHRGKMMLLIFFYFFFLVVYLEPSGFSC